MWEINAWELIKLGGPLMAPIVLCSVLAVSITISKLTYLARISTDVRGLKTQIFTLLKSNDIKAAVRVCDTNPSSVARILKAGILKSGLAREEIKEAMEEASVFEIPLLEKNLTALSTIANICPLLGLLGTAVGMTTIFHAIQATSRGLNPVTAGDLAGGIWQALLTTVAGLMVAIPAFVAYHYLLNRVNALILEMERAAGELVNFLAHFAEPSTCALTPAEENE